MFIVVILCDIYAGISIFLILETKFFIENGVSVNAYNNNALIESVRQGSVDTVKLLIENRVNVNDKYDAAIFISQFNSIRASRLIGLLSRRTPSWLNWLSLGN